MCKCHYFWYHVSIINELYYSVYLHKCFIKSSWRKFSCMWWKQRNLLLNEKNNKIIVSLWQMLQNSTSESDSIRAIDSTWCDKSSLRNYCHQKTINVIFKVAHSHKLEGTHWHTSLEDSELQFVNKAEPRRF